MRTDENSIPAKKSLPSPDGQHSSLECLPITLMSLRSRPMIPKREPAANLASSNASAAFAGSVAQVLLGAEMGAQLEIPPLVDIAHAVADLAEARRFRSVLPLVSTAGEVVLERRDQRVLVSVIDHTGATEVLVRNRVAVLADVLSTLQSIGHEDANEPSASGIRARTRFECADILRGIHVRPDPRVSPSIVATGTRASLLDDASQDPFAGRWVEKVGGTQEVLDESTPLAFGFRVRVSPIADPAPEGTQRADVHALLHEGTLWAISRGRKRDVARGPIYLMIDRMVSAVRALVDATGTGRAVNVRRRTTTLPFAFGIRAGASASEPSSVAVTIGSEETGLTVPGLSIDDAALPVLKIASDYLRAVVQVDRAQSRNLRFVGLRDEVRALRREIRRRTTASSFQNENAERLRNSQTQIEVGVPSTREEGEYVAPPVGRLRFSERWRAEIEGLDSTNTFMCGDRLVIASPRRVVALSRDDGSALWLRRCERAASVMVGTSLVRVGMDGEVEIWDVSDGEVHARGRVAPRAGAAPTAMYVGGGALPPAVILAEGRNRLVALDLRTGDATWRFSTRGAGGFRLRRLGRIAVVVAGDNVVHGLDVVSGEAVWRFASSRRFATAPLLVRDRVYVASGEPGQPGTLHALDLFSGKRVFDAPLTHGPLAAPVYCPAADDQNGRVLVSVSDPRVKLAAFETQTGSMTWSIPDPGVGRGAGHLVVDDALIVNAPNGTCSAVSVADGSTRWARALANPVADDVPRRLDPVLRGGAVFVPSSEVHVFRPADGAPFGTAVECDLVPDYLRVDERNWLYVAEDSGHLRAFAPAPSLRLIS